jgi:hypothetical protein
MIWQFVRKHSPSGLLPSIDYAFVKADRWYDARHFVETLFGCSHDDVEWSIFEDPREVALIQTNFFELYWTGHGAGKHDTLALNVRQLTQRKFTVRELSHRKRL